MDFIEFQDFSVVDNSTSDLINGDSLPEPMQRLNLSSISTISKYVTNDTDFKLPDFNSVESKTNQNVNLYEKMTKYANMSIETLKNNNAKSKNLDDRISDYSIDTPQLTGSDRNKMMRSFDDIVNKSPSELRNTDTKNLVLSKKLSKILNDYNANNYQNTITLKKNLKALEQNKDTLALDNEKLISAEYIGTLSRKALRSNIENELLKEHITVLEEFRPIIRRIKRFSGPLEKIRRDSKEILDTDGSGSKNKSKDKLLLENVDKLRSEMELLTLRKELLLAIKDKFTLTQVEDDIIMNGNFNDDYFIVINKVLYIKEHVTYLLALPNLDAGTALITKVNDYLNVINRKMFNYLVDFLYNFESNSESYYSMKDGQDEYNIQTFQRGLIYISNDLEYFKEFLKKVASVRSKSFLDKFLSQFDLSSHGKEDVRPIILSAHDPIRYISDVLASVHSLIANEADFIKSLFKFQFEEFDDTPKSILQENTSEFLDGLDIKLLNEIVQSITNTCRIRIEQIVRFEENSTTNFEIVQLLQLYQLMFVKKGILEGNSLITTLKSLTEISNEKIIKSFVEFLKRNVKPIEYNSQSDLLQPDWLSDYLNNIVEFFEIYERSSSGDNDNEYDEEEDSGTINTKMLQTIIREPFTETLLKQLQSAFPMAKKNEEIKLSLLTVEINSFDLIKSRLQPFANAIFNKNDIYRGFLTEVNDKLNGFVEQMKELQSKFLFEKTGLGLYNNLFNMIFPIDSVQDELDYDMYLSLNDNPLMNLDTINESVHEKLNKYAPLALTDIQENLLFKLSSPSIADDICEYCFIKLSKFYGAFQKILIHLNPEQEMKILEILNFSQMEFNMLVGIEQDTNELL